MAPRKKLKERGRAIIKAKDNIVGPDFNVLDYRLSMIRNLNFYTTEVDAKKKQQFAIDFYKQHGKSTVGFSALNPDHFGTVGSVAHMKTYRDLPVSDEDIAQLLNKHAYFANIVAEKAKIAAQQEAAAADKPKVQKQIVDPVPEIIGELEGMLDDVIKGNKPADPDAFLQRNFAKPATCTRVSQWFKSKEAELQEAYAGKNDELNEGYSNLGKRGLKRVLDFLALIQTACTKSTAIAKIVRKPRAKKIVPPSKIVENLIYMKEYPELNIKSVTPTKIVGATELYAFNTKLRRLIYIVAMEGQQLTVKGTTIKNFDPLKSSSKIVRKPADIAKKFDGIGKRAFSQLYKLIKGTEGKVTGRINEDIVLLSTF
jgi:hypothetical protein